MKFINRRKKDNRFFDLLVRQTEFTVQGMETLKEYMKEPDAALADKLKKTESEADEVRRI
jgi:uncharacterized protein Yka (UPF0111/DUF47 family)